MLLKVTHNQLPPWLPTLFLPKIACIPLSAAADSKTLTLAAMKQQQQTDQVERAWYWRDCDGEWIALDTEADWQSATASAAEHQQQQNAKTTTTTVLRIATWPTTVTNLPMRNFATALGSSMVMRFLFFFLVLPTVLECVLGPTFGHTLALWVRLFAMYDGLRGVLWAKKRPAPVPEEEQMHANKHTDTKPNSPACASAAEAAAADTTSEHPLAAHIKTLQELGFTDVIANVRALRACDNNLVRAVNVLLTPPPPTTVIEQKGE